MTAHPPDVLADLNQLVAELEQRLESSFVAHDRAIAQQAATAQENAELQSELTDACNREAASAEILHIIASSPSDVQPVFQAIAASANRLIGGFSTAVFRFIDGLVHLAAFTPTNPVADKFLTERFPRPLAEFPAFAWVSVGGPAQIADTESDAWPGIQELARSRGFRSMLFVPLMNGDDPIGIISVTRKEPGAFATHHVHLLQTFADQAVIAIENVRLFDEVQAKTRDLSESLQQQTAPADVPKA